VEIEQHRRSEITRQLSSVVGKQKVRRRAHTITLLCSTSSRAARRASRLANSPTIARSKQRKPPALKPSLRSTGSRAARHIPLFTQACFCSHRRPLCVAQDQTADRLNELLGPTSSPDTHLLKSSDAFINQQDGLFSEVHDNAFVSFKTYLAASIAVQSMHGGK